MISGISNFHAEAVGEGYGASHSKTRSTAPQIKRDLSSSSWGIHPIQQIHRYHDVNALFGAVFVHSFFRRRHRENKGLVVGW